MDNTYEKPEIQVIEIFPESSILVDSSLPPGISPSPLPPGIGWD